MEPTKPSPAPAPVVAPAPAAPPPPAAPAPVAAAVEAPAPVVVEAPKPEELTATVAQPEAPAVTPDALAAMADKAGGNPAMLLALGGVAIAGSAGGLKLIKSWFENKKEVEMKKLEVQAEASKGADYSVNQPPPCAASSMKLEAELSAANHKLALCMDEVQLLSEKCAKLDKKLAAVPSFDSDELDERLDKLEKELKALKGKPAAKPAAKK